jgi:GNAT superfamily N-acetyltransferase
MRAQEFISEISDERLQQYLSRAGRQVDARQERMARVRDRLNKGYEIYHAETPSKIVDRFEANTPQEAKRYYDDFITKYESDVDYDLRLRRATGIMEDTEDYAGMQLRLSKDADGVAVRALAGGKELGMAEFFFNNQGQLDPQTVWVDERYHGQGIAAAMYNFLKDKGYTIVRSWDQTDAGRGFWDKHRGEEATVWEDAVTDLEKTLKEPHSYSAIDHMMQNIAREEGITAKELHDRFVGKHGMTPDDWIKDRLSENFADGKVKGKSRPGRVKRAGASCAGSVTDLRKRAKNASGERAKMYHWCANMKSGRKKNK